MLLGEAERVRGGGSWAILLLGKKGVFFGGGDAGVVTGATRSGNKSSEVR